MTATVAPRPQASTGTLEAPATHAPRQLVGFDTLFTLVFALFGWAMGIERL